MSTYASGRPFGLDAGGNIVEVTRPTEGRSRVTVVKPSAYTAATPLDPKTVQVSDLTILPFSSGHVSEMAHYLLDGPREDVGVHNFHRDRIPFYERLSAWGLAWDLSFAHLKHVHELDYPVIVQDAIDLHRRAAEIDAPGTVNHPALTDGACEG